MAGGVEQLATERREWFGLTARAWPPLRCEPDRVGPFAAGILGRAGAAVTTPVLAGPAQLPEGRNDICS